MTDPPRPWDRRTPDSDPAYDACAAYLDTGSLRDAYQQRSGAELRNAPARFLAFIFPTGVHHRPGVRGV